MFEPAKHTILPVITFQAGDTGPHSDSVSSRAGVEAVLLLSSWTEQRGHWSAATNLDAGGVHLNLGRSAYFTPGTNSRCPELHLEQLLLEFSSFCVKRPDQSS
jgi:hypothetical protein